MQRINQAYQALGDYSYQSSTASASDSTRASSNGGGPFWGFGGYRAHQEESEDFDDPFGFYSMARRGRTITRTLKVNLFEAAFGFEKRMTGKVTDHCSDCGGSGVESARVTACEKCHGRGVSKRSPYYCNACGGSGYCRKTCQTCRGTGKGVMREWEVTIKCDGPVTDGDVVVGPSLGGKSGKGDENRGDLQVRIAIEDHPLFSLDETELTVRAHISIWKWLSGGTITIPTLDGSTTVDIKPMSDYTIMVPSQGWPKKVRPGAPPERHPLRVDLLIEDPEGLTSDQMVLLEALAKTGRIRKVDDYEQKVKAYAGLTAQERREGAQKRQRKDAP